MVIDPCVNHLTHNSRHYTIPVLGPLISSSPAMTAIYFIYILIPDGHVSFFERQLLIEIKTCLGEFIFQNTVSVNEGRAVLFRLGGSSRTVDRSWRDREGFRHRRFSPTACNDLPHGGVEC